MWFRVFKGLKGLIYCYSPQQKCPTKTVDLSADWRWQGVRSIKKIQIFILKLHCLLELLTFSFPPPPSIY